MSVLGSLSLPDFALGLSALVAAVLLAVWWQQQTFRWPLIVAACLALAPALSWWSGLAFVVADYRAGCDGLCRGYRGAPIPIFRGEVAGDAFLPASFAVSALIYLALLLAWAAIVYAVVRSSFLARLSSGTRRLLIPALLVAPFAAAPLFLPPPEAHVRGDPLRIAINAEREVFMYDDKAPAPVLRVALEDVRPRRDGSPGMRVCLRTYTLFYLPTGYLYLDMAPEGVHSTAGGALPVDGSCWE